MRHQNKVKTLGRKKAARTALLKSQAGAIVIHENIKTTQAKAKVLKSHIEKLITKAKKGDLATRRYIKRYLATENEVKKLIEEVAPRYKDRNGGYTRIVKIGPRLGDGAEMVQIELVK